MALSLMLLLCFPCLPSFSQAVFRAQRTKYVGDAACASCHKDQSAAYLHTGHHLASQLANKASILGSFSGGQAILKILDSGLMASGPGLRFKMEAKRGGYYQTAVTDWGSFLQTRSERIDIVIGSGVHGQSYLYWKGDQLYELPVSYWSDGRQWINSPGFRDGAADFSRPADPRCMECHVTYIQPLSADRLTNRYRKESLVTGISCETCHGPGSDHIARERAGEAAPIGSTAPAILNPAKFSRDRQIELCSLCHNGARSEEISPAFSYVPGEPLDKHLISGPADAAEHPDVHGDQVGLLKRSRCYLSSPTMSCSTCHDVHAAERPDVAYSARCLTCHQWQSCGISKSMGPKIANDCIDCHMPKEQTAAIVSETAHKVVRATMRNHWIRVYPGAHDPGL